jgi:hypothetical protein
VISAIIILRSKFSISDWGKSLYRLKLIIRISRYACSNLLQNCHHSESFTVSTMTWLTVIEHNRDHRWPRLSHMTTWSQITTWPRLCSVWRRDNSAIPSWLIIGSFSNSNRTGSTRVAGIAYPHGASEFTSGFLIGLELFNL